MNAQYDPQLIASPSPFICYQFGRPPAATVITEQWPTEQTRAKVERTSAIPTTSVDGTFLNHITARSIHSIRSAAAFSPAAALHRLSHGPGAPILMIRLLARETDRGRPFFRGQVPCVRVIPVSADFAWRLCGNERMY